MASSFVDYLENRLPLVERALAGSGGRPFCDGTLGADLDRYLYDPLARFTASGGKRVRPVLALLGAEAVGGAAEDALSSAVAVELFQSAALIHDDIADEGELRRGEPCLYLVEGVGPAINAGDLALTRVFEVVLDDPRLDDARRLRALRDLALMERHTLEGQALDLCWVRDSRWDVSSDDYLYMVTSKTAWYSAAMPLHVGALAGGGSDAAADGLRDVGLAAGIAFQLQDDLLNLVGDAQAQGKDFRSDITEGKRTLAVVWALEHLSNEKSTELVGLLDAHTSDQASLARAVELIEEGGGIQRCRDLARERADEAKRIARALLSEGHVSVEAHGLLCSMADFFVERAD